MLVREDIQAKIRERVLKNINESRIDVILYEGLEEVTEASQSSTRRSIISNLSRKLLQKVPLGLCEQFVLLITP